MHSIILQNAASNNANENSSNEQAKLRADLLRMIMRNEAERKAHSPHAKISPPISGNLQQFKK